MRRPLPEGAWAPPAGPVASTYAIASDLSEVIETTDGFGAFKTELEAIEKLVSMLIAEKQDIAEKLGRARRRRTYLQKRKPT